METRSEGMNEDVKSYNTVIGESCSSSSPQVTKGVPKIGEKRI